MGYVFEKALPPRRPPWPPTGAGGAENPRAESPRPGGPEHRRRNGRLTHTTGHRSAATLVVSSASAPTCDYHTPHSPLPVWSPCSISRRLWPAARWPPRLVAAPTTVRTTLGQRTTRPAHESRQPAPPTGAASATPSFCTRHCGATTDALRSPLQPCPGRSRRVRAVRGPYCVLGDGRLGVEPLRPERCTTMSVRRYSVYSASRASRVHAPYVRVSRAPAPGGCLRLSISRS